MCWKMTSISSYHNNVKTEADFSIRHYCTCTRGARAPDFHTPVLPEDYALPLTICTQLFETMMG